MKVCFLDTLQIVEQINNMTTQTIMESANATFDGFKDFAEFSKEQQIFSFIDKAKAQVSKETGPNFATPSTDLPVPATVATPPATLLTVPIPPETPPKLEFETTEAPREVTDQARKEPSSRVQKNHLY